MDDMKYKKALNKAAGEVRSDFATDGAGRALGAALGLALVVASCAVWQGQANRPALPASAVLEHRPELQFGRSDEFDYDPPAAGSYVLPAIQEAGDGEVLGPDGAARRLGDVLEGKINVLSFIYTRCSDPSACPRASGMLRQIHLFSQEDPVLAQNVRLVTLSFDPEYDKPEVIRTYGDIVQAKGEGAEWRFLTTRGRAELAPILASYGQLVQRKNDPQDRYGPLAHTIRVHLIDRNGQVRNIYSFGLLDPRLVVTDIRTLLLEEAAKTGASSGGVEVTNES